MRYFPCFERFYRSLVPNITGDLPEDVSLWPGLPLSLSGDEVCHWITTQVVAAGCCMVVAG